MDTTSSTDWLSFLFEWAEGEIEFRALGEGKPRLLFTRDPDVLERFVARGGDIYVAVATRAPGSAPPGRLETVWRVPALWVDLDRVEDKAAVLALLRGCYCPPSAVIDSGGGLHLYWRLAEAEPPDEALVALLKGLARVFGGDPSVCDLARIMRLPGTLNHKYDPPRPCTVLWQSDVVYQLPDLQEWLTWQCPLRGPPVDPWLAAAARAGVRAPLDVEEALAAMEPGNIHDRQLRVSASLAAHGVPEEEIVTRLLTATRLAAGEKGRRWDWRKEEAGIRAMIGGAKAKFQVIDLQQERLERAPAAPKGKGAILEKVARVALEAWGRPLITVEGELWTYEGGAWTLLTAGELHDLRTRVHGAARLLKAVEDKVLNGAWRWIKEDPERVRRGVKWNALPVIVAENGALDLETREIVPHSPEHHATFRVACKLEQGAQCPVWLAFLERALPEDTAACIATLQEWFGAMLVRSKSRELNKGLMIYGPSYTGKTRISNVARALLGGEERCCSLEVRQLGDHFGMQSMVGAAGWIADDAVGKHEVMDAERYKKIITGEPFEIARKNQPALRTGFDLPALLTMNHFPKIHDNSEAVFNRTLALLMRVVIDRKQAFDVSAVVIAQELAGVLNWALEGWYRLRARGWFDPPGVMVASLQEFRSENNPFNEFAQLCVLSNLDRMVQRAVFREAFNAWLMEEIQPRNPYSGKAIAEMIKHAMPAVTSGQDPQKRGRMWVGLELTEAALQYLNGYDKPVLTLQQVNLPVPVSMRRRAVKTVF